MQPITRSIAKGAEFFSIPDTRFKTARLTVALLLPLKEETASANAIIPFLLRRSCVEYPDFATLQHRLNELYGARILADVSRVGESQALILSAVSIDDRFALHQEQVAAQCAKLLCSMLFSPVLVNDCFPEEDVLQEKRCLTELIQSEVNEKRLYARHRCEQLLCKGEGYSVNRYGTIEGVAELTPQIITEAWRKALETAQIRLIHQGAGDPSIIANAFRAGFDSLTSRKPVSCTVHTAFDNTRDIKNVTERMNVNQSKLVMGLRTNMKSLSDYVPAMRLMNALFGGSPHSLLFRNVREKLSLCYYCASSYDRLKGVLLVDSGVEESNAHRAQEEILRQLAAIQKGDFTDEDLESARRSIVNRFHSIEDLQSSLASFYIGQSLDDKLVTPEQAANEITSVTRNQIIAAACSIIPRTVYLLAGEENDHE